MGYHSDVCIRCERKPFEAVVEYCKKEDCLPDTILKNNKGIYTLEWESVKWYSWGDKIEHILEAFDLPFEEGEEECGYKFVRIGEEANDNIEKGNDWEMDLYISRMICYEQFGCEEITVE